MIRVTAFIILSVLLTACVRENPLVESKHTEAHYLYSVIYERVSDQHYFHPKDTIYDYSASFDVVKYSNDEQDYIIGYRNSEVAFLQDYLDNIFYEDCPIFLSECRQFHILTRMDDQLDHYSFWKYSQDSTSRFMFDSFPYSSENLQLNSNEWVWNVYNYELVNLY